MTGTPVTLTDETGIERFRGTQVGGGGSQPQNVRRLDLGVVTALDCGDGPVTLYTPDPGELVGPVYLYDVVAVGSTLAVIIGRDEQGSSDSNAPPLAGWDADLSRDGAGFASQAQDLKHVPLTTGPVIAALGAGSDVLGAPILGWEATHAYAQFDQIAAAGHIWEADPGGTSGGSIPDFAGHFGGSVADNDITWNDHDTITTGSAHVYADVTSPAVP